MYPSFLYRLAAVLVLVLLKKTSNSSNPRWWQRKTLFIFFTLVGWQRTKKDFLLNIKYDYRLWPSFRSSSCRL
jgi:hypothetical protein